MLYDERSLSVSKSSLLGHEEIATVSPPLSGRGAAGTALFVLINVYYDDFSRASAVKPCPPFRASDIKP